jgi:serine kinase of HPr protein (carbohydrate metabolism regulator)
VIGEAGVLIRGSSGSGKSRLAREVVSEARHAGRFARLVCDDQVEIEERHGRLLARAISAIEGQIEIRGLGLCAASHEPAAVIRLVVDCLAEPAERMPDEDAMRTELAGVSVPRLGQQIASGVWRIVLWRLGDIDDTRMTLS